MAKPSTGRKTIDLGPLAADAEKARKAGGFTSLAEMMRSLLRDHLERTAPRPRINKEGA